jgi:peptidoglycan/LPS O-acetylase OafA/YrhL
MPKPVGKGQRYLPGLDGLRALAVAVVVAYHLGLGWAGGGLLGVGVFFTLSGYLITDILVGQWRATRKIHLKKFWLGRARRLLPALFALLAVIAAWVAIGYPGQFATVRDDIAAAALYVSNWWFIVRDASYFTHFGPPSPAGHLWSLAVEEQFYLLWPWFVAAGGLATARLWPNPGLPRPRNAWVAVTLALTAASFAAMALVYHPGLDPTRAYEGTDTRAGGLLVGAALALVWPTRYRPAQHRPAQHRPAQHRPAQYRPAQGTTAQHRMARHGSSPRAALLLDACGAVGLALIGVLIWRTTEYSPFMFRGGMLLLSLATALVIAAVVHPASRLGWILGIAPLRWLGVRSYGIYLWHYPLIVLMAPGGNPDNESLSGLQQVGLALLCVVVAALSWSLIEDPVRSRRRPRLPATGSAVALTRWARGGWLRTATASATVLAVGGVAVTGTLVLAAGLQSAGQRPDVLAGDRASGSSPGGTAGGTAGGAGSGSSTGSGSGAAAAPAQWYGSLGPAVTSAQDEADARAAGPAAAYAAGLPEPQPRTSCQSVVHIGDSTSDGLISSNYLPDPAQRIPARYAQVGVSGVHMEVVGGTSIVEEYDNQPNAFEVATRYKQGGYQGCWVLALGTNDTADVAVGSAVGLAARITKMMSAIGNQPVLWITVKSLLSAGPYAEHNMLLWDQALYAAQSRYPNMRIYDWASVVQPQWFISDEIHYTSAGYAARAELIADALAAAFPASQPANAQANGHSGTGAASGGPASSQQWTQLPENLPPG